MKITQLVLLLISCFPIISQGQTFSREFGSLSQEEVDLKEYALDKDAEAVVIFDIAKSHFPRVENSFDVTFERTTRIKILSEAGIKWAEVEIPFYQEEGLKEIIFDIQAFSYNFEGNQIEKTPLDVSNTYNEKLNEHWMVKKFAIPNVKAGSIIEYRYKIDSPYKFNLRDWEFQWRIPVVHSEYEVHMIPFYEYSWLLQGSNRFDDKVTAVDRTDRQFGSVTFRDKIHRYIMKNVPAFDNEAFITSINDYIIKLDFQLSRINYPNGSALNIMTTWKEMIRSMVGYKDFGKYQNKAEKLASKLLDQKMLEGKTEKEKFEYVLDYVKNNFNWNQTYGYYTTKSASKFVEHKFGNVAEVNLFTIGLLKKAGIEAYPVLISTRSHGKIKYDYPFSHFFNYVVILSNIEGQTILSDATEALGLNNRIPTRCINDKGLIINKEKVEWVGLECLFLSEINTLMEMEIGEENVLTSQITQTSTEYDALASRYNYSGDIQSVREKLEEDGYRIEEESIAIKNLKSKGKPFAIKYQLETKPEVVGNKIYLAPFLKETPSDNPFKQKRRTYPVDMVYPKKRFYETVVKIPEGYQVDFLPKNQKINNELFELNYSVTPTEGKITVQFGYTFKKTLYTSSQYSKVKFYYGEILNKGNEKIVLVKK